MTDHTNDGVIAPVNTDDGNDVFAFLERFGGHDRQYAVLLSTLISFSKIIGDDLPQLLADIRANYARVPAPSIVAEH